MVVIHWADYLLVLSTKWEHLNMNWMSRSGYLARLEIMWAQVQNFKSSSSVSIFVTCVQSMQLMSSTILQILFGDCTWSYVWLVSQIRNHLKSLFRWLFLGVYLLLHGINILQTCWNIIVVLFKQFFLLHIPIVVIFKQFCKEFYLLLHGINILQIC